MTLTRAEARELVDRVITEYEYWEEANSYCWHARDEVDAKDKAVGAVLSWQAFPLTEYVGKHRAPSR